MTNKKAKITVKEDGISEVLSASIETITGNEDLVTEILLCVPAKSLTRLKYVCKDWCTIISSSRFAYNQYIRNLNVVSGIYLHPDGRYYANDPLKSLSLCGTLSHVDLSFIDEFDKGCGLLLKHSCNGLSLLAQTFDDFFVCNLTTRKYVKLIQVGCGLRYPSHARLAFDPSLSPYYKVVLFFNKIISGFYPIYIYSSEYKSWRSVQVDASPGPGKIVFWDGFIHWVNESNTHYRFMVDEERLITTQMSPKPKILKACNIHYFGECGDRLLLIQNRSRSIMRFNVLEMKRGTSLWNVKYRVNLNHVMFAQPPKGLKYFVLGIVKESCESDISLILATPNKLFSYNLRRQTVGFVRDFSLNDQFFRVRNSPCYSNFRGCFPFIESLFPVSFETLTHADNL